MLRTRIITALVLLPAAYWLVFRMTPDAFAIIAGALLLVGAWEFHRLADLPLAPWGIGLVALQTALLIALQLNWEAWTANPILAFQLACLAWLILLAQLRLYRPGKPPGSAYRLRGSASAICVITFGWMALAWLRFEPAGEWWILSLLLIIWASDVGAYFTGRALGRSKLAPNISPGKTNAGLLGGLVLAALVAAGCALLIEPLHASWPVLATLGIVTALVSVGGDLFISMHKRTVGLKDCGRIFPGHGGVLDRLDSLLAGAPFFALGKLLAGL